MHRILPQGGLIAVNLDNTRDAKTQRYYYHTDLIRHILGDIGFIIKGRHDVNLLKNDSLNPMGRAVDGQRIKPEDRVVDCGEYIWAKHQMVAKRAARGSIGKPSRRPNHEYVLFFRKGNADDQASTMLDRELNEMTISAWEEKEFKEFPEYEQKLWGTYWKIAARPNKNHPAAFPPDLAYRMVTYGGSLTDVVCDPFSGSGTTLYIAARTGRKYLGIDQNPDYVRLSEEAGLKGQKAFHKAQSN